MSGGNQGLGEEREVRSYCLFKGYRVYVWDNEKVLEMDSGWWLHNTVKVLNGPEFSP